MNTETLNSPAAALSGQSKLIGSLLMASLGGFSRSVLQIIFDEFKSFESFPKSYKGLSEHDIDLILSELCSKGYAELSGSKYSISKEYDAFFFQYPLLIGCSEDLAKCVRQVINSLNPLDFAYSEFSHFNYSSPPCDYYLDIAPRGDSHSFYNSIIDNTPCDPGRIVRLLTPFSEDVICLLPTQAQLYFFKNYHLYKAATFNSLPQETPDRIIAYFKRPVWLKNDDFKFSCAHLMAEHLIMRGEFAEAKTYLELSTSAEKYAISAVLLYIFHGHKAALEAFNEAFKMLRKEKRRRRVSFSSFADIFYFISLIQEGTSESLSEAYKFSNDTEKALSIVFELFYPLNEFYSAKITGKAPSERLELYLSKEVSFSAFLTLFIKRWLNADITESIKQIAYYTFTKAKNAGFLWPAAEILELLQELNYALSPSEQEFLEAWKEKYTIPLCSRIAQKPRWQTVIDSINLAMNLSAHVSSEHRLIWVIDLKRCSDGFFVLRALEQNKLKSGKWSAGKEVNSLFYHYADGTRELPNFYSPQDRRLVMRLQNEKHTIADIDLLFELASHPLVFSSKNLDKPIKIIKKEPVLVLSENKDKTLRLGFFPKYEGKRVIIAYDSAFCLRICKFSEQQAAIAEYLSACSCFPPVALEQLKQLLSDANTLTPVHTTVEGAQDITQIASIPAHSSIYARLTPIKDGLSAELFVRPFGKSGPRFVPSAGSEDVFAEISGQKLHTKRDFIKESENLNSVKASVEALASIDSSDYYTEINGVEESLQALFDLQEAKNTILEWPENAKIKQIKKAEFGAFKFNLSGHRNWFELDGELKIDDGHVISLQRLLSLYDGSSRFVALDDERFLAITDELKKKLLDIKTFTNDLDGKNLVHNSSMQLIESILEDAESVKYDKTWHDAIVKYKKAARLEIRLPKELNGILRAYQQEGYFWLARMAYLGFGACLADDMGLGKTLEALSIILARANEGPAFVLAPTSVCTNWYNETNRFTPSLNPVLFGQSDRNAVIAGLKPHDLIICSYGVLQREIESLSKVNWATIVLDEAQSIKNMATSRSQAAMQLKGDFKMLMTGTPIENHLGELYNLFRFLNPGLLGSIDKFNEKFANPIQNLGNKHAQERLKRLVAPFILRRTKNQVLSNLPPKTEITLTVDLSPQERTLYESMRRNAIDRINSHSEKSNERSMVVLAEIMKLRRMCCNPSLVAPELEIESSKLSRLSEIADDLIESSHKALIFSQFVDHLTIVRKMFEQKHIHYQYLDGSTPIKARNKAINAFQAGDGDFFLISLKAGGLGLSLTAADYVIHLDPWWNPAVEDQASDRAHRIGQTRPVTIYKLITSNTIEEKIVQLHKFKRDLADGLLSGADMAGRVSTAQLIKLIGDSSLSRASE